MLSTNMTKKEFVPTSVKWLNAEQMFRKAELIDNKKSDFCSPDYAYLINTLELFYKGFLEEKAFIEEYEYDEDMRDYLKSHYLYRILRDVEDFVILTDRPRNYEERQALKNSYNELTHAYTASRYDKFYSYDDFHELFLIVNDQRNYLLRELKEDTYSQRYAYRR